MTNAHTPTRIRQREVEELLAFLHDVEQENKALIRRAYEFTDEQSFIAGNRQKQVLEKMRLFLETTWRVLDEQNKNTNGS